MEALTSPPEKQVSDLAQNLSSGEIQTVIDEVVWYHGDDPSFWSDSVFEGLNSKGILSKDITRRRLVSAQNHRDRELTKRVTKAEQGEPIQIEWNSRGIRRETVVQRLKDLKRSRQHRSDNEDVAKAECITNLKVKGCAMAISSILRVKASEVRACLMAMGFNADDETKWNLKRLNLKLGSSDKFNSLLEAAQKKPEDQLHLDLLMNISDALKEGQEIEVVEDLVPQPESNGHVEKVRKPREPKQPDPEVTDVVKALANKPPRIRTGRPGPRGSRPGSLMDAVIQVLKNRKKGLKPQEIYDIIVEKGLWKEKAGKTPVATLSASLYNEINKKGEESRFAKGEEKGTFVLRHVAKASVPETAEA